MNQIVQHKAIVSDLTNQLHNAYLERKQGNWLDRKFKSTKESALIAKLSDANQELQQAIQDATPINKLELLAEAGMAIAVGVAMGKADVVSDSLAAIKTVGNVAKAASKLK